MEWNMIYIVVYLIFGITFEATARSYGRCPALKLKNGSVKSRTNGRMAKFRCDSSYQLVGNSYAFCNNGRWEVPMPICIKSGCDELPAIANGVHDITHDGSLARFVCHYGFELEGPREIFCNGLSWNDTIPKCRGTKEVSKLSCNFDSGMCDWDDDELHDFNWRRKMTGSKVHQLIWLPVTDHTNSSTGQGGYIYTERQSTFTNQSARLLSPSYHSDLTKDGCFSFYYYRINPFQGRLKIYQKPDSVDITTLTSTEQGRKYLRFESTAGTSRRWENGFFYLNESDEDFQIVFEGFSRPFLPSSIAIDDVAIMRGHQCIVNITKDTTPEVDFRYSCANRCGSKDLQPLITEFKICGCEESCLLTDSCCSDFRDICEFGTEETTTDVTTTEITLIEQSYTTKAKKSSEMTNGAIVLPSSRNLVTQSTNSKPTPEPFSPTVYVPSFKGTGTTISTHAKYFNAWVTTSTSRSSRATGTTTPLPESEKSYTGLGTTTASTKKIPISYQTLTTSTASKQFSTLTRILPRWTTTSTSTYEPTVTSTTTEVYLPTTTGRFYEGNGTTAQTNQTDKVVSAQQSAEDEKRAYSHRMKVTTICLAVFLCICGSTILIIYIVKRRNDIRSLITRLRIGHEFAKSHVAKESEVRFLIREDEVDLE